MTCGAVKPRLNEIVADDLGESIATFSFVFLAADVAAWSFVGVKIAMRPDAERASNVG